MYDGDICFTHSIFINLLSQEMKLKVRRNGLKTLQTFLMKAKTNRKYFKIGLLKYCESFQMV